MKHHTITLQGGPAGLRVPADVLVELVSALQEGALRAARFVVEGESVRKGPKPAWLDAVGRFDVTGLTQGSAVLQVEAPSLAEALPERFGLAGDGDALWEQPPATRPVKSTPVAQLVPQDEASGVASFFGTWPGDESDEELLAELDLASQAHPEGSRNMGRNDLWIAAAAKAAGATLLTTDNDFDHLFPENLAGVVIDPKVAATREK